MINLEINLARLEEERSALEMLCEEMLCEERLEQYNKLRQDHMELTAKYYSLLNQFIDLQKKDKKSYGDIE